MTSEFQGYVRECKFKVYLCRKADPESKGMIENVVKYIKVILPIAEFLDIYMIGIIAPYSGWNVQVIIMYTTQQKRDQQKCFSSKSNTYY